MKTRLLPPAALAALFPLFVVASPVEDATAALKRGDHAAAESLVAPLTSDAAALNVLSQVRLAQNRNAEAVTAAEQAVKLDATQADYHAQLGNALARRMGEVGFMQQAMLAGRLKRTYEQALALDSKHVAGLIGLGRYYSNAPEIAGGSLPKARELALRLRDVRADLGESELGGIAEREEDFAAALAHYEKLVELRPDHGWPHHQCARMLAKLGRKDEARARFETALRHDPNLEVARKALAELDQPAG